jgi:hypothetical protein
MLSQGGVWRCAFFDREPHALFGEDVKTRNAILLRREINGNPPRRHAAEFWTGPLRKWTSRTRHNLFSSITFTPLTQRLSTRGIPKLDGEDQAKAYSFLSTRSDALKTLWVSARTCRPLEACQASARPYVFVASTAYNFLNVFRWLSIDSESQYPLTENTVLCLEFAQNKFAEIAFAILSSRLIYWLWYVQGDGFHVPR